jgi:LuxR family transcriptional regulator, maltose regulon positive regulatory protein
LQAKTDGWVAGLLLLLQLGEFEDIEPCRLVKHTPSEIFDYFGSVLFQRLDPSVQQSLIRLSFLPRISPLTADKLAGSNATDILEKLHTGNAFTYRTIGENPRYSFHPLFQEFLQSQCRKRFSPAEVREVQSLSAAALAVEGELDDAVGLYLHAGQIDQAVNLILSQAPGLHMQGRIQTLSGWLNALPATLIETLPWLIFWQGVCTVPNAPKEGQACFNKALVAFEAEGDPVGCYLALSGVIEAIIFQANDYAALDPYIDKYAKFRERWGEIEDVEVQLHLTNSLLMAMVMRRGNSPDLPIWVAKAWDLLRRLQDANVTLKLFIGLLTLQTISGDFAASQDVLDAMQEAIPEKGPKLPHLFHMNLRACHCWSVGRFEEGLASAERGIEIEVECGIRLLYSGFRTHAACAAIGLGRMDLARRYLDEVASVVPLEGNWIQVLYHSMRSWYELRAGNLSRARFHAQIHYEKAIAAGNNLSMPLSHALMAVIFYESGEPDEAKKHLDMGFAASRGYSGQLYDFKGYLLKSRIALAEGDLAMAAQMLRKGFAIGARRNYRYFNHWQPEVMAKLCVEALKRHIEPDYVRSLVVEHRLVPQTPPTDIPGWPWPVRMSTLGCFRLEKCGEPVPSSRKAQQRPLAMLKYLVARGGRNIPTHEIEEVLWPDADGDAASNVFSTTLHRLRRLLGNDDAVRFTEATLSLDEFLVWVDVQAFEQCSLRVARTVAGTCDAADLLPLRDTLIALYQGPFLPGEPSAWAIPIRQRLQERFFTALCTLAQAFEELGRFDDAAQCCRYGLTLDPLVESLYCPLMRITFYQGRKNEALQLYERCRSLLDSELGLTPSEMLESVKKSLFG